jgi:glycerophosphoryl diester phosphodiesterase
MKIYAHRGSSGKHPEMTRMAYEAAIKEGADGFECDVRLSKDRKIVCIHDATTKRIAGRRLRVSRTNLEELQSAHELLTLDELIKLAISAKKDLLVETKHPNVFGGRIERSVVELLQLMAAQINEAGIEVIVMSFSKFAGRRIETNWVAGKVSKYYLPAVYSKSKISALDISLITKHPALVAKISAKGSKVLVWTVNEEAEFELCKKLSVDGIITNFPEIARRYG